MKTIGIFVRLIWLSFMSIVVYITISEVVTNLIKKYRDKKEMEEIADEMLNNV